MEEPYPNLRQGKVKVKVKKDERVDLPALVKLLETEVGFAPVTEVMLEARGQVKREKGKLRLEVGGTGQVLTIKRVEGKPPVDAELLVTAALADMRSGEQIVLKEWRPASP